MQTFSVPEQAHVVNRINVIVQQFINSKGKIRPHFLLTGATGTGKSINVQAVVKANKAKFIEINAAQITEEGVSGNSLSKALKPLENLSGVPVVVFVDEADKIFTNGSGGKGKASSINVQNEFLKLLEADSMSVIGDYGHYNTINTSKVLYVFAGAFSGSENTTSDSLAKMGVRPEFLGRISAVLEMPRVNLESYISVAENHELLKSYAEHNPALFTAANTKKILKTIKERITDMYPNNMLGLRLVSNLIHETVITELIAQSEK